MKGVDTCESGMVKLTIVNYSYWKYLVEEHLMYRELVEPIQNENVPIGKNANEGNMLIVRFWPLFESTLSGVCVKHVSTLTMHIDFGNILTSSSKKKTPL